MVDLCPSAKASSSCGIPFAPIGFEVRATRCGWWRGPPFGMLARGRLESHGEHAEVVDEVSDSGLRARRRHVELFVRQRREQVRRSSGSRMEIDHS